jgi:Domain of unknown function (DUF3883)
MTESLKPNLIVFERVSLRNIQAMLDLMMDGDFGDAEYLKRRFAERAVEFDATQSFLIHCGIVRESASGPVLATDCVRGEMTATELRTILIGRLTNHTGPVRQSLMEYLRRFRIINGKAIHWPTVEQRSEETWVRNLLIELNSITCAGLNGHYELTPAFHPIFLSAIRSLPRRAPADVKKRRQEKDDLGNAAEVEVVRFELDRLGQLYADRVIHVATTDAAAGYDIESITVTGDDCSPRFIEVKAVSLHDYRFFWTANEVAVARSLGSWYYLYLLPVEKSGRFSPEKMEIVCDPALNILERPSTWSIESNVLECKLMPS